MARTGGGGSVVWKHTSRSVVSLCVILSIYICTHVFLATLFYWYWRRARRRGLAPLPTTGQPRRRSPYSLDGHRIDVVESSIQCEEILASKSQELLGVLGLDCEWVSQQDEGGGRKGEGQGIRIGGERENSSGGGGREGDRHLVALLQLAFLDGHCVLVRLCKIGATLPPTLSTLLQDNK